MTCYLETLFLILRLVFVPKIDSCSFIDYEYGSFNYRGFDIANHFCEYAGFDCNWSLYPSREFQTRWISEYLYSFSSDESVESVLAEVAAFESAAHLFWAIWALVQAEISDLDFDYLEYAIMRLERYNLAVKLLDQ
jgi:ethanolamine kinase